MTEERKLQIPVVVDATGAKQGFGEVKAAAQDMAQAVAQAGATASKGVDGIGAGAPAASAKLDVATKNIIGSIQRTTAIMEAGGRTSAKYYEALAAQRGVSVEALKPYLAQLDAVAAKQAQATGSMKAGAAGLDNVGMSAKATSAALRGVPAQFTDIITALQGGQRPLSVFLQQGGQLKDMFGGAGAAARALGGYIGGLVNPVTLAVGAVGGLALAYHAGSQEAVAYSKALILSGNAAGTTASLLQGYAENIAKVTGNQGVASAALAEFAESGAVGAQNLEQFTRAAIRFETATGQAVGKTVEQFAELERSPLAATIKLNERYNFLTDAVYKQIKALEEQGNVIEAVNVAQTAFANTIDGRATAIVQNLGLIERGWLGIKSAIKGAFDAALDVGRAPTTKNQVDILKEQLQQRQERNLTLGIKDGAGTQDLKDQINLLQEQERLMRRGAEASAAQAAQVKARIEFDKDGEQFLSKQDRLNKEILKTEREGLAAGASKLEIQRRIAAITEKFKDSGAATAAKDAASQYAELMLRIDQRIALSNQELESGRQLTDVEREQIRTLELLNSEKGKLGPVQRAAIQANLEEAKTKETLVLVQRSELVLAQEIAKARQAFKTSDYEQSAAAIRDAAAASAQGLAAVKDRSSSLKNEAEAIQLSTRLNISLAEATELVTIARLQEKQAGFIVGSDGAQAIERELQARKEMLGLLKQRAEYDQFQDMWKSIDRTAHDVFTNIFDGGSNAFKKLGQTLKASLLDLLYQMTVKKWIIQIAASVSGNGSSGGLASMMGGGQGGNGMIGMASNGMSMYNTASSVGTVGSQWMAGTMSTANAGGTLYANAMGTGLDGLLATNGAYGTAAGAGGASGAGGVGAAGMGPMAGVAMLLLPFFAAWKEGFFNGEKRSGGTFGYSSANGFRKIEGPSGGMTKEQDDAVAALMAGTASGLNSAFSTMGLNLSVTDTVGAWEDSPLGKGHGGVFSGLTLSDGTRVGETGEGSNYDVDRGGNQSKYEIWSGQRSDLMGDRTTRMKYDLDGSPEEFQTDMQQTYLAALQAAAGIAPRIEAEKYKYLVDFGGSNENEGTAEFEGTRYNRIFDQEMKDAARAAGKLPKMILDLIVDIDPEMLSKEATAALTEKIAKMVANVEGFRNIVDTMPVDKLRGASFEVSHALIELTGGLEAFGANISSFVENFYSDNEKRDFSAKNVSDQLKSVGVNFSETQLLNTSRAEWRAVMEAQDLTTDSGRKAYAALLNVSGAFASITASTNESAMALTSAAAANREYANELRAFVDGLMLSEKSPLNAFQKTSEAERQFNVAVAAAKAGNRDAGALTSSGSNYLEAALASAGSRSEYDAIFAKVAAELSLMATSADSSTTIAEQQLTALNAINGNVGALAEAIASFSVDEASRVAAAERLAAEAREVAARAAAEAAADAASKSAEAARLSEIGRTHGSTAQTAWTALLTGQVDAAYVRDLSKEQRALVDPNNYLSSFANYAIFGGAEVQGFATGGVHMGGVRLVGEQGPELEVTGPSRIYSASETRSMLQGAGNSHAVVAELQLLGRAVARQQIALEAIAQRAYETSKNTREMKDRGVPVINNPDGTRLLVTT